MSHDLVLKPVCGRCGSTTDLYGSNCKHITLCLTCGKTMAQNRAKCYECGAMLTRLIREYPVRVSSSVDKNYSIGRFEETGLPNFSKKKNAENKWSLQREGLVGRQQVTDLLREKYKKKPWVLEDESGQFQYHGHPESVQAATYYLLMMQGKEFNAIPACSWYNFKKVAQYNQLTLEEAEEKMKNRRKTADGYERWIMKAAKDGPAAFGEGGKFDEPESGGLTGVKGRRNKKSDEDEDNASDKGDDDGDDEFGRKNNLNKRGNDDEEGGHGGDDFDDEIEKGDDWEHDETFTDDDEACAVDPDEREDLALEVPAPPEIKEDDEEEEERNEEEGGLSKSGKELKKLLGRNAMNESDDDDDDDEDMDDDNLSPVLAPKKKDAPKEEPIDNSPAKPAPPGFAKGTPPTSKSSKGKRKLNGDDVKPSNGALQKKVKSENGQESKPTVKEEPRATPSSSTTSPVATGPVTEEEIKAVIMARAPLTTQELVAHFKARLRTQAEKAPFAEILKRISKIQKTNGANYVVLREP